MVGCAPLEVDDDDDDDGGYDPSCLPAGVTPASEPRFATVRANIDGDTATFDIDGLGRNNVRFLSVNTPEVSNGDWAGDCFGAAASDLTAERLPPGTAVWLTFGPELRDDFDRVLAYIHLGESPSCTDYDDWVNLTMVAGGEGCEYVWGNNQNWLDQFRAAEADARDARLGLWGVCRDAEQLCR